MDYLLNNKLLFVEFTLDCQDMIQKNIVSFNSLLCGYTDSFHLVAVVCFERLDFIFGQNLVSDFTLKKLNM